MIYVEPKAGLANRMRVIAASLMLQEETGQKLKCVWRQTPELNVPYHVLFLPIAEMNMAKTPSWYRYVTSLPSAWHKKIVIRIIHILMNISLLVSDEDFNSSGKQTIAKMKSVLQSGGVYTGLY